MDLRPFNTALALAGFFAFQGLAPSSSAAANPAPVDLLNACSFAVLAGGNVGNINVSSITGDVGSATQSGFGTVTVIGTNHFNGASTTAAQASLLTAYNDASTRVVTTTLPTELGGTVQGPGVFRADSGTFSLTGVLTLNGGGDGNAVFIFKTDSTLVTAASSSVSLSNGAQAQNVFWVVGSSVTLGATSTFAGSILANTAITLGAGVTINGRLLAKDAAVSLDSDMIIHDFACTSPTPTRSPTPSITPTPSFGPTTSFTTTPSPTPADPSSSIDPSGALRFRTDRNAFDPRQGPLTLTGYAPSSGLLELEVYDLAGRLVRRLLSQEQVAGPWMASWDGRDDRGQETGNDVYLILLRMGTAQQLKKAAVLRY